MQALSLSNKIATQRGTPPAGWIFTAFIEIFNQERPQQALDMKCPAEAYRPVARLDQGLPDVDYPFHDKTIVVTSLRPHLSGQ